VKSVLFTGQGFLPSQQFGVDLRELLDLLLELMEVVNAVFGGLLLSGTFEEELVHFSHGQTLSQIIKGTVFVSSMAAVAIGFATAAESLDQRGAQAIGRDLDLGEQEAFAFAQSQGGFVGIEYLSHNYGKDDKNGIGVNKKESAPEMRKCLSAGKPVGP